MRSELNMSRSTTEALGTADGIGNNGFLSDR